MTRSTFSSIQGLKSENEILKEKLLFIESFVRDARANKPVEDRTMYGILRYLKEDIQHRHQDVEEECYVEMLRNPGISQSAISRLLSDHATFDDYIIMMENGLMDAVKGKAVGALRFVLTAKRYVRLMQEHIEMENALYSSAARAEEMNMSKQQEEAAVEMTEDVFDNPLRLSRIVRSIRELFGASFARPSFG